MYEMPLLIYEELTKFKEQIIKAFSFWILRIYQIEINER
jgi:hypothetical protein